MKMWENPICKYLKHAKARQLVDYMQYTVNKSVPKEKEAEINGNLQMKNGRENTA